MIKSGEEIIEEIKLVFISEILRGELEFIEHENFNPQTRYIDCMIVSDDRILFFVDLIRDVYRVTSIYEKRIILYTEYELYSKMKKILSIYREGRD